MYEQGKRKEADPPVLGNPRQHPVTTPVSPVQEVGIEDKLKLLRTEIAKIIAQNNNDNISQ